MRPTIEARCWSWLAKNPYQPNASKAVDRRRVRALRACALILEQGGDRDVMPLHRENARLAGETLRSLYP